MMQPLVHIKMRYTQEDIICTVKSFTETDLELSNPIALQCNPQVGIFARNWLMFGANSTVRIRTDDIISCALASPLAIEYYNEFIAKFSSSEMVKNMNPVELAMIESKHTKFKH